MRQRANGQDQLVSGQLSTWAGVVRVTASPAGIRNVWLPRWGGRSEHTGNAGMAASVELGVEPSVELGVELGVDSTPEGEAGRRLQHALRELAEYFAGERQAFTVPLDLVGTPFLCRAWEEVAHVPYGQTRSYQEIADAIGAPAAARAVGRANAINPLAPLVPCHRIIGSDGRLTGYGPGLPLKLWLLRMEDALPAGAADYDDWITRLAARSPGHQVVLGIRRTRTYCLPGCDRSRALADLPARIFSSPDEAAATGFAACPSCAGR